MSKTILCEIIDRRRRRFIGAGAAAIAAPSLGLSGTALAQAAAPIRALLPAIVPGSNTSFRAR